MKRLSKTAMMARRAALLPATDDNIAAARAFVLARWRERAEERAIAARSLGRQEQGPALPNDLSSACNFAALFAWIVFGGRLRANSEHSFVEGIGGELIDLTAGSAMFEDFRAAGFEPHHHDSTFFYLDRTYHEQLDSCLERVEGWVAQFVEAAR